MTAAYPQKLTGKEFYCLQGDGGGTEVFTYVGIATTVDSNHAADVESVMVNDTSSPSALASRMSVVKAKTWDLSLGGLADPKALQRIRTLFDTGAAGNFQVMKNFTGANGGNIEQGAFIVTDLMESSADKGLVKFSCNLIGQGVPTVTANA